MKSTKTTAAKLTANPDKEFNEMVEARITAALIRQSLIKEYKDELELDKQFFADLLKSKQETKLVTASGAVTYKKTQSFSMDDKMIPAVKDSLGKSFKLLFDEKIEYKPNAKFKELLSSGDFRDIDLLREATKIRLSESVTFDAPTFTGKN
jgi:hypothetical protein